MKIYELVKKLGVHKNKFKKLEIDYDGQSFNDDEIEITESDERVYIHLGRK